jgi:hypothetical protein
VVTGETGAKIREDEWGISDETIHAIVKSELRCDGIHIIVDNVGVPQTVCDQLGGCNDYADMQLAIEGVCEGKGIKGSYVLRLYRGELGSYRGFIQCVLPR